MSVLSRDKLFAGALSCLFAVAALPGSAHGQGQENEETKKNIARNYVIEGDEALEKGDTARALDRFERAERLIPAPTVRLRIARLYAKTGKLIEARDKYKLAASTELAKDSPDIFARAIVEAQKELAEIELKIPTIEIVPPQGESGVKLDGKPIEGDALAKPVEVNPGHHVVSMPCCGEQEKDVPEGARERLVFQAAPKEVAPQMTTNWRFVGGLGAVGVGVVSLGVGLFAGTLKVNSLNNDPELVRIRQQYASEDLCGPNSPIVGADKATFQASCDEGKSAELMQFIFYPLAAVSLGAGAFLLVTSGGTLKKPAESRVDVLPTFGRGQAGFVVQGSF